MNDLLDGRVQLAGEQMRVTVQLTSLRDRAVIWASQFNEKLTDILLIQDSIAAQVAEAIVPKLTGDDRARLAQRGTDNLQAYEAYLRGRYHCIATRWTVRRVFRPMENSLFIFAITTKRDKMIC